MLKNVVKMDTWGECRTDKAPPYTEEVPRELDAVYETALQFVNELPITTRLQSWIVVVPKNVGVKGTLPLEYTNAPATMATAPPIACLRITSKLHRRA